MMIDTIIHLTLIQILPTRLIKVNKININLTSKAKQRLNEVKLIRPGSGIDNDLKKLE